MTILPQTINDRKILYLQLRDSVEELKRATISNWVVFVIADDANLPILERFADVCIDKDVLYMCAAGKACSQVDDFFDMNMVMRDVERKSRPSWYKSDEDVLMTTWHHDFDEGFWFCTRASYGEYPIDTVLVANLTDTDYLPKVKELTELMSEGWLPAK